MMRLIIPGAVFNRLMRMANTSPGPDGARYYVLKRANPGCHVLSKIYDPCLRMNRVPEAWIDSTTILVYKAGDKDHLHNWRPLSLGDY